MLDGHEFERAVQLLCRELFPAEDGGGSISIDGLERDGLYITESTVFVIEATIERGQAKAKDAYRKLGKACEQLNRKFPDRAIKGLFVTQGEPTPDQKSVFMMSGGKISAVSYDFLRSKLVDGKKYVSLRRNYYFGSIRDPYNGGPMKVEDYLQNSLVEESTGSLLNANNISLDLLAGSKFVINGDYGIGKSATLHQIFEILAKKYLSDKSLFFPIHINLRDHHSQEDPVELIERHARNVGYPHPNHLVRAWRSGFATILLDGFDEIATTGWTGEISKLRQMRKKALIAINRLVEQTPRGSGIVLCGRRNYFDSDSELRAALGLNDEFRFVEVAEFDRTQVAQFLAKHNLSASLPSWVPSRPLLLGELLAKGIIDNTFTTDAALSPAEGWDYLLNRIALREARIGTTLESETVRNILERLASKARRHPDGLGPITIQEIRDSFSEMTGSLPDDSGLQLLMRLPGFGSFRNEESSRIFVDSDLADVARAGDIVRYIAEPSGENNVSASAWLCPLGQLGQEVVLEKTQKMNINVAQIYHALTATTKSENRKDIGSDLMAVLMESGFQKKGVRLSLKDLLIEELEFSEDSPDLSDIIFEECIFNRIIFGMSEIMKLPIFKNCVVQKVEGIKSAGFLSEKNQGLTVESYGDGLETNAKLLKANLPPGVKVLLTILRKLYVQRGTGRRESSFVRGLDQGMKSLVPTVLTIIRKEKLVSLSRQIWIPDRSFLPRVAKIIAAPAISIDPVVAECAKL